MALVSRYGPLGLRKEYSYAEIMRAIENQPLELQHPKRAGLKQYEDIFFNNLINDQMAYQGDPAKGGFAHDAPRQKPHRPDVFFDADDGQGGNRGDDGDDGQGPSHPFGRLPARLPIESGHLLPDFVGPPLQLPEMPNPRHNVIQEEGLEMPPEPPGFLRQVGQSVHQGLRSGTINRAGELGVMGGAMAADAAANRLRAIGGAVRDGVLDRTHFWVREFPEMAAQAFARRAPPPPIDFGQAAAEAAGAAEEAEMANIGLGGVLGAGEAAGALEGAEAGILGGPVGMLMGAGIGGAAAETASLMFRNRDAPQQQSSYLDARSLNNQNQSVQPLRPRLHRHGEAASSSNQVPNFYIGSRPQSVDLSSAQRSALLRPTAAPPPQPQQRSAQGIIDAMAAPAPRGERVQLRRPAPSQAPVIEGDPNPGMLADRVPQESYRDIMQSTAAPTVGARNKKRPGGYSGSPYAFPMSGAPPVPRPSSSREPAPGAANRRNKAPPKKKEDK